MVQRGHKGLQDLQGREREEEQLVPQGCKVRLAQLEAQMGNLCIIIMALLQEVFFLILLLLLRAQQGLKFL